MAGAAHLLNDNTGDKVHLGVRCQVGVKLGFTIDMTKVTIIAAGDGSWGS